MFIYLFVMFQLRNTPTRHFRIVYLLFYAKLAAHVIPLLLITVMKGSVIQDYFVSMIEIKQVSIICTKEWEKEKWVILLCKIFLWTILLLRQRKYLLLFHQIYGNLIYSHLRERNYKTIISMILCTYSAYFLYLDY